VAFLGIILMWFTNHLQTLPFALASIVVFVANCCFLQRRSTPERHSTLIGYAILALLGIMIMFLVNRLQWSLLTAEGVIVCAGIWAGWLLFRTPSVQAGRPQTQQETLNAAIARTISPRAVLMDLFYSIFTFGKNNTATARPTSGVLPSLDDDPV
jgi:hypothetical protein